MAQAIPAILFVVGTGISAYASYQQGQSQKAIADYNAKQRERQAGIDRLNLQVQAAQQKRQAEINYQMQAAEADARFRNQKLLEDRALAQDRLVRENLRRRRGDFQRLKAEQRAKFAASGLVESTGTPLDILAETAAAIQQDQEEGLYRAELERRQLFAESRQERLGGQLALAGATLDRDSALVAANLTRARADAAYLAGRSEARVLRLTGKALASEATTKAIGSTVAGVSEGYSMLPSTYKLS